MRIRVVRDCSCGFCGSRLWEMSEFSPEEWDMENYPGGLWVIGFDVTDGEPDLAHGDRLYEPVSDLWELVYDLSICPVSGDSVTTVIFPA